MRNRVIPVLAATAAMGVSALFAAPASASNGPPPAICTSGSSCIVQLNYTITYTGSSGGNNGVAFTPPPCIGVPAGDAHSGSQAIISLLAPVPSPSTASPSPSPSSPSSSSSASSAGTASPSPSASSPSATASSPPPPDNLPPVEQKILNQAEELVKTNPIAPGEWYQIAADPYATVAAQQVCSTLPLYVWVPGGGRLRVHGLPIPEEVLAALAYNQLTTAMLGAVTLDPKGTSDTNLPTFVDVVLLQPRRGVLSITPDGTPYVWATALAPNGQAATVWAKVTGLTIDPGTGASRTYQGSQCALAHLGGKNGREFILGSRYSQRDMSRTGVNQPIDCGVTYTAPGTYHLKVSVSWDACWSPGLATALGPPAGNACKPVPGAVGGLQDSTTTPIPINVREVQSVNG